VHVFDSALTEYNSVFCVKYSEETLLLKVIIFVFRTESHSRQGLLSSVLSIVQPNRGNSYSKDLTDNLGLFCLFYR